MADSSDDPILNAYQGRRGAETMQALSAAALGVLVYGGATLLATALFGASGWTPIIGWAAGGATIGLMVRRYDVAAPLAAVTAFLIGTLGTIVANWPPEIGTGNALLIVVGFAAAALLGAVLGALLSLSLRGQPAQPRQPFDRDTEPGSATE